jgi:hypothetical protein
MGLTTVGSRAGARILLVLGFLAAWVGYDAWIVSHAVLDPNATRAAAHALLQAPAVRRGLADEITTQLDKKVPAAKEDPHAPAAVAAALSDPRVTGAFADTIAQIHTAVVSSAPAQSSDETFTIDGHALSNALYDALAPNDPQLAAQVRQAPPLTAHIKVKDMPKLHDPRSTADVVTLLAVMAALLLITASLLVQHDRRTIGRVGRRTAFLAATPLFVFVALPLVLSHGSGDAQQIVSELLRVYGHRVLPSAIVLAVVGLSVAVGAIVWPRAHVDPATTRAVPPYTGPEPPRPRTAPDQPAITEKMYL